MYACTLCLFLRTPTPEWIRYTPINYRCKTRCLKLPIYIFIFCVFHNVREMKGKYARPTHRVRVRLIDFHSRPVYARSVRYLLYSLFFYFYFFFMFGPFWGTNSISSAAPFFVTASNAEKTATRQGKRAVPTAVRDIRTIYRARIRRTVK